VPLPNAYLFSSYLGFYGKAYGQGNPFMLKPGDTWTSSDGEKRTALMSDILYYNGANNITRLNHPGKVPTLQSSVGGGTSYFRQRYITGKVTHPTTYASTLFVDMSVIGLRGGGLAAVAPAAPLANEVVYIAPE
jgi:hypothetical protein